MVEAVTDDAVVAIDGDERQIRAGTEAASQRVPVDVARRRRTPMVGEAGVLLDPDLFVAIIGPRNDSHAIECRYRREAVKRAQ